LHYGRKPQQSALFTFFRISPIDYSFNKDTVPVLLLEKLNTLKEEKGVLSVKTVFKNPET
jgi:hypothetical protein